MYWAMLALTASLLAGIALQLFAWLWGFDWRIAVLLGIFAGIAIGLWWSWRIWRF